MTQTIVKFGEDVELHVTPNAEHEWTLPTADVAAGYDISIDALKKAKLRHTTEFVEGRHFITETVATVSTGDKLSPVGNLQTKRTLWTKAGVVRLGFHVKSKAAKAFRDWAEAYILAPAGSDFARGHGLPNVLTLDAEGRTWYCLSELTAYIGAATGSSQTVSRLAQGQARKFAAPGKPAAVWFVTEEAARAILAASRKRQSARPAPVPEPTGRTFPTPAEASVLCELAALTAARTDVPPDVRLGVLRRLV